MTAASDNLAKALGTAFATAAKAAVRPDNVSIQLAEIAVVHLGVALDGYAEEVARRARRCAVHDLPIERLTA